MNIFVIGGGAREHSIIWSLKKSKNCGDIFCSPGNAGIERIASCHSLDFNDSKSKNIKNSLKRSLKALEKLFKSSLKAP